METATLASGEHSPARPRPHSTRPSARSPSPDTCPRTCAALPESCRWACRIACGFLRRPQWFPARAACLRPSRRPALPLRSSKRRARGRATFNRSGGRVLEFHRGKSCASGPCPSWAAHGDAGRFGIYQEKYAVGRHSDDQVCNRGIGHEEACLPVSLSPEAVRDLEVRRDSSLRLLPEKLQSARASPLQMGERYCFFCSRLPQASINSPGHRDGGKQRPRQHGAYPASSIRSASSTLPSPMPPLRPRER